MYSEGGREGRASEAGNRSYQPVKLTFQILEVINQNNIRFMEGIDEDEIHVSASVGSRIVADHTTMQNSE